jgi:hypothetical protein
METDEIYKYVGVFMVVIIVLYIIYTLLKYQRNVSEGLTSMKKNTSDADKVPDAIKTNTTQMEDSLLIDKYSKAYEDTILELDSNIDMFVLNQILNNAEQISSDPGSDENQQLLTKLNTAKAFKDTLNHAIKVLDKK